MIDIALLVVVGASYVLWFIISERWYGGYYDRKKNETLESENISDSREREWVGDTKTRRSEAVREFIGRFL